MLKVLSVDVGIKNLAVCLLQHDVETSHVLRWDTLDIVQEEVFSCNARLKSGEHCPSRGVFRGKTGDGLCAHYCGSHKKYHECRMPPLTIVERTADRCLQGKCKSKGQVW